MEYQNENDTNWTYVGSVTSPYELTGLDANTAYNIRIRSNCGGGDYSNWTLTSCRTECSVITSLPYTENFDSYGTGGDAFPFCWDRFDSNSDLMPYIYDGGYQSTGSMYFYANNGIYNMAITPEFDASIPLNTLRASFMYKATYSSDRLLVGVISDPEDASTFVAIDTVYPDPTSVSAWVEKEVDFSGYDGTGARYIAFKNQYVSNYAYAYIDNRICRRLLGHSRDTSCGQWHLSFCVFRLCQLRLFRSEHLGNERWSHHGGSAGIQQRHQHPAHLDVG